MKSSLLCETCTKVLFPFDYKSPNNTIIPILASRRILPVCCQRQGLGLISRGEIEVNFTDHPSYIEMSSVQNPYDIPFYLVGRDPYNGNVIVPISG